MVGQCAPTLITLRRLDTWKRYELLLRWQDEKRKAGQRAPPLVTHTGGYDLKFSGHAIYIRLRIVKQKRHAIAMPADKIEYVHPRLKADRQAN